MTILPKEKFLINNKHLKLDKNFDIDEDVKFLKSKLANYNIQLSKKFNEIHKQKLNRKFWTIVLNFYILSICTILLREYKCFKKIQNKTKIINSLRKKIYLPELETLEESHIFFHHNNIQLYNLIRFIVSKKIGLKVPSTKIIFKRKNKYIEKINLQNFIIKKFIRLYCYIFKPTLILNPFFGKKKSLNIFFKSKGRLLLIPEKIFFEKQKFSSSLRNKFLRDKIYIKEADTFDEMFNEILSLTLPYSLVENFNYFYIKNIGLSKKIKRIGSSGLISFNDNFKFLSGLIKNYGGKIVSLQHGGGINKSKFEMTELDAKICCDKTYTWTEKKGFATNVLYKLENLKKVIKEKTVKSLKNILIMPYAKSFNVPTNKIYIKHKHHMFNSYDYVFYKNLNNKYKKNTIIKVLQNQPETKFHINVWKKKFGLNVKVTDKYDSSYFFSRSKIVIVDDIYSTAVHELAFLEIPFIIIENNYYDFKNRFQNIIKRLKKLNIIFDNPEKAANFINRNYNDIEIWWKNIVKTRDYKNFKKTLFRENKDLDGKLFYESLRKI